MLIKISPPPVFQHQGGWDEKYEDEFVDDEVLNSFVGAPN